MNKTLIFSMRLQFYLGLNVKQKANKIRLYRKGLLLHSGIGGFGSEAM